MRDNENYKWMEINREIILHTMKSNGGLLGIFILIVERIFLCVWETEPITKRIRSTIRNMELDYIVYKLQGLI